MRYTTEHSVVLCLALILLPAGARGAPLREGKAVFDGIPELPAGARGAPRREGKLVFDGIPELPARVRAGVRPYGAVRSATLLDWAPSGDAMLITTRLGEADQIHEVRAPGGARTQLTFFEEPVTEAAYAPGAGQAGFAFRMDEGGGEFYQYYWFDRRTGTHTLLTDGSSRNMGLIVSPRGGRAAYCSTARNGKDFDIYVMDGPRLGTRRLLLETEGLWLPMQWSADESELLVLRYVSINESYLYLVDVKRGTRRPIPATTPPGTRVAIRDAAFGPKGVFYAADADAEFLRLTHWDRATDRATVVAPALRWDVDALSVSPDGRWLAYTVNAGGASELHLASTATPGEARRVELPVGTASGLHFDPGSRVLGLTVSTAGSPGDVYVVELASAAVQRWTRSEVGGLDPEGFGRPELVEFPTFDERSIPAWYYRAPAGAGSTPAPVVVLIHGGPEGQTRPGFSRFSQYVNRALGVAVVAPNVRGSSGYGKGYLLLDNGRLREDSVRDVGALLDWIGQQPELDAGRVAVLGGSYGGYMVLAALVHHGQRLRCAVDVVGITNFVTFLENTQGYRRDLRRAEYGDERDPDMRRFLLSISPTTHARRINKPLLVAQGANDPRVPASESEQIVAAVREGGTQVWSLLAEDEGHGFRKRGNRDALLATIGLFLQEFLLPATQR